ncbi:hypothetical protein ABZX39_29165 [Streptomyces collinus]|uniref:toll/interleukin-1 receptor domain-containing protein n=1 Tax=Streptomyces collinus TaxID=42684 RepID=UPI0033A9C9CA
MNGSFLGRRTVVKDGYVYDGFISYSQAVSGELATTLQRWLERFATPWYGLRRLRIFRDFTSLPATHNLPKTIQDALSGARWLILLASPGAARSGWVEDEVAWWRAHRGDEHVIIVLTDGELKWNNAAGDWDEAATNALPPSAKGMFAAQPLWVDLRTVTSTKELDKSNVDLLNKVAQIAAPLRGVDKDSIVGEHISLHRRARRQRRGGVAGLVFLLISAVVAALLAVNNAAEARAQARVAQARALASAPVANLDTNLDVSQLLAAEAYRMDPNPQTRSALLQAVTASPKLVRYLLADSAITTVAGSDDQKWLLAGTKSGSVLRWDTRHYTENVILRFHHALTGLSVSKDGATVVATDGETVRLWNGTAKARTMTLKPGYKPWLVGVSPSGKSAVVYSHASGSVAAPSDDLNAQAGALTVLDTGTQQSTQTKTDSAWSSMAVPSDRQMVLFDSAYGSWERRDLPALRRQGGGTVGFGTANYASALSPGGGVFTYTNGDTWLPLWQTEEPTPAVDEQTFEATSAGPRPSALAISRNGRSAATVNNGSIIVSAVTPAGAPRAVAAQISGAGTVSENDVAFVGDGGRLVSASGPRLAYWDLTQLSRIAERVKADVPLSCNACSEPWLVVAPDKRTVALSGSGGSWANLYSFNSAKSYEDMRDDVSRPLLGPPVFTANGTAVAVPTPNNGSAEIFDLGTGQITGQRWPQVEPTNSVKATVLSKDKKRIVVVTGSDTVVVRDARDGRILKQIRAPEGAGEPYDQQYIATAAVDSSTSHAAVVTDKGARLIDIGTGTSKDIPLAKTRAVRFAGPYLALQSEGGSIRLWNVLNQRWQKSVTEARPTAGVFAISSDASQLAQRLQDDTVALEDLDNGEHIGALHIDTAHPAVKSALAFADDGTVLFVATEETDKRSGEIQRWSISPEVWMQTACVSAGRDLTPGEWKRYVGTNPPDNLRCSR